MVTRLSVSEWERDLPAAPASIRQDGSAPRFREPLPSHVNKKVFTVRNNRKCGDREAPGWEKLGDSTAWPRIQLVIFSMRAGPWMDSRDVMNARCLPTQAPRSPSWERNCFFLVYCSESADTFPRRTPAHCPSQGHTALLQSVRRKKGEPGPVCAIQDSLPCGDKVPLPCGQTSEKIRVLHKNETGWICGRGPTVSATESNKHSHDDDHKCMATGNREICRLINPSPQISRSYFMA